MANNKKSYNALISRQIQAEQAPTAAPRQQPEANEGLLLLEFLRSEGKLNRRGDDKDLLRLA
jgi:hypothetical protein